ADDWQAGLVQALRQVSLHARLIGGRARQGVEHQAVGQAIPAGHVRQVSVVGIGRRHNGARADADARPLAFHAAHAQFDLCPTFRSGASARKSESTKSASWSVGASQRPRTTPGAAMVESAGTPCSTILPLSRSAPKTRRPSASAHVSMAPTPATCAASALIWL